MLFLLVAKGGICDFSLSLGHKFQNYEDDICFCRYDYDCFRRGFVLRRYRCRTAVDRRPVRRHQGDPLRGSRIRAAAARGEGADLLPGRGGQVRARHPVRPELRREPPGAPYAGDRLPQLRGRPHRARVEGAGEIPQESVVRQRHPSPLFERQVRARVHGGLSARRDRDHSRGEVRRAERAARRRVHGHLRPADVPDPAQPAGGRRPAVDLVEQLLPQRAPGRGREVLRRHGGGRRGQSRAGELRPEFAAGQARGDERNSRTGVESGRNVFAGHRAHRLLAGEGRRGRAPPLGSSGPRRWPPSRRRATSPR